MGYRGARAFALVGAVVAVGCAPNGDTATPADTPESASAHVSAPQREPTYGLIDEVDGYRLEVGEVPNVGGQAIGIHLDRDGAPVTSVEGEAAHVFAIGAGLAFFQHDVFPADRVLPWLGGWKNINGTGTNHVVVMFDDEDGPVVLGTAVEVLEESDFGGSRAVGIDGSYQIEAGVAVERDGWDFRLAVPWGGDPTAGDVAWLTLVRPSDLSLAFAVAELVGDRTFRFDPELPGAGEYLAVLEFLPYGYRPNLDADVQGLTNFTAPARFLFRVVVDEHGELVETPADELVAAVDALTTMFGEGDADGTWELVSVRCRALWGRAEFEATFGLGTEVDVEPRRATGIGVSITGNRGTATYSTAYGVYEPGVQPYSPTTSGERWVDEAGWRWDDC